MRLRKRISIARERTAQARAKRRDEQRRAARAKQTATASQRSKARSELRADADAEKAKGKKPKPAGKPKPKARPAAGAKGKSKVTALRSRTAADSKRPAAKLGRTVVADLRKLGGKVASVGTEVLKLGREMLVIPVQLWLAGAEIAGAFVLRVWLRAVRPLLVGIWRFGRATLRFAERHVTPARAVAAVSLVAVGVLAASQWVDYHSVSVGADAYAGAIGAVAPAPEVESEVAGNAHAWVMLPLAVAALVVLTIALSGRRRAAILLVPIGIVVIAVGLIVDVPKGLDEGTAAVAYEGASASLLEGFWLQIAAGVVLVACGLLLPRYLRPITAEAKRAAELTGPSLFDKLAAAARKGAARRPKLKVKLPRPKPKRKVPGAAQVRRSP